MQFNRLHSSNGCSTSYRTASPGPSSIPRSPVQSMWGRGSTSAQQDGQSGWIGKGCITWRRPNPPSSIQWKESSGANGSYHSADSPAVDNGKDGKDGLPYDRTTFVAETLLPTKVGKFRVRGYRHTVDGGRSFTEPCAIIVGNPEGQEEVAVRVHDACFTSEVLGSLKCDCAEQLQLALNFIQDNPPGIVIYLQQEGRGIGLANKIAAYALQEGGLDTVDANRALGLPDDCREYTSVRNILKDMKVKSIRLMTNNPRKINVLQGLGVPITDRLPCIVESQEFNKGYLAVKQARMDHDLDGSFCYWNHEGESAMLLSSDDPTGV